MYEYDVIFIKTRKKHVIYGYNFQDACIKHGINPSEVEMIHWKFLELSK